MAECAAGTGRAGTAWRGGTGRPAGTVWRGGTAGCAVTAEYVVISRMDAVSRAGPIFRPAGVPCSLHPASPPVRVWGLAARKVRSPTSITTTPAQAAAAVRLYPPREPAASMA